MRIHNLIPIRGKILFLLAVLFAFAVDWGYAQNITISGTLRDSVTEEVMELVSVRLLDTKYGANTNLEGEFSVTVPKGEYVLFIRVSGYDQFLDTLGFVDKDITGLDIRLRPVSLGVEGLTITSKAVNPAHRVIRNAIKNRKYNRFSKIDAYEYEAYNKLVITADNVTDKLLKSKVISDIGETVKSFLDDSLHTDSSKYKVAIFISESISKFYYKRPDLKKEEILAVQTSGVEGSDVNLLSSMFLQIDIYENNIGILNKQFLSPIAAGAFLDYDYELMSAEINGFDTLYGIKIIPKRAYDPVFKGEVYIDNHDWAVNRIDLSMNANPNINFVEDVRIRQEYMKIDTFWVPSLLDLEVDFQNSLTKRKGGEGTGLIGRTSSYLYNYTINVPREHKFFMQEVMEIKEGAENTDSTFWAEHRRSPLEKSEKLGFAIVDSVKNIGMMKFYIDAVRTITVGTKKTKYFELGPYWYIAGFNQIEGPRLRFGIYTRKDLSKRLYMGAHLAYGFRDNQFKYMAEARYRVNAKPRLEVGFRSMREVEQVGVDDFMEEGTSLMATMLRRVRLYQLNYFQENKFSVYYDLLRGVAADVWVRTKTFEPGSTFDFRYAPLNEPERERYQFSEVGGNFRISFKEDYIISNGKKVYIDSNWPIFNLQMAYGKSGILGSDLDYKKVSLTASNWMRIGKFGYTDYKITGGIILGELPYPALNVFRGNLSWGYDRKGFNLMDYYEFVADRYVTAVADHHFEGLIWNQLPLLRRLKFKTVATARLAWGTLTDANRQINAVDIPLQDGSIFQQRIKAPDGLLPYAEAGVGLENILKFIRVDGIWRLNYHNLRFREDPVRFPKSNWGKFNNFGIRVNIAVSF